MLKKVLLPSILIITIFSFSSYSQTNVNLDSIWIVRDTWGVPHIYANTDVEAAYGLVWAACEDDFESVQENILAVRHRLGEVKGKDGAIIDFVSHIFDLENLVAEKYDESFSPKYKQMLEAAAMAYNRYIELHPEECLVKYKKPIEPQEIVQGYALAMLFMTSVEQELIQIFQGKLDLYDYALPGGSNAAAVSGKRTADGKTYLLVNSHQPLEGPYAWYEAHVNSNEGWNMLGGTFPGAVSIFVGANENLGWAHTLNHPDLTDVYKLTMHPKDKNKYKFDGEWLELEKRPLKIKVKVGFIKLPVKRTFYWSKFGPVIKSKDKNYYAIHPVAIESISASEQFYHMNKARNFDEFKKAMNMGGHPGMNTIYADQEQNIYMLSNGHFPCRNPNYNWRKVLPGDTSATLWEPVFYPIDILPQKLNPECGYLYNANNSPFLCTSDEENPDPDKYDQTFDYLRYHTNRSLRFEQLFDALTGQQISYQDFKNIKYDGSGANPITSYSAGNLELLFNMDKTKYPELADVIDILSTWDRKSNIENTGASIVLLCMDYIARQMMKEGSAYIPKELPEEWYAEGLKFARKHLMKHFGTLEVPLGDIQKHVRGDVELPMYGLLDVIASSWPQKWKKGKFRTFVGDSYIQFVRFSGTDVEIESVNSYGASNHEENPHHTDQMQMFVNQQLKTMSFDRAKVWENAEKIYHPQ